ncbi:MAG: amino acid permease [Gammaproteobacteria bacterium]|nr:amino acid permease [Gammaproteobacteria bacterium]
MKEMVELKRSISLPLLTFYGLGTILGAGIYVLIGEVVAEAGMRAPLSFLVAALLAVFTALSYAELSARFPRSAGEAVYLQEAFHHRSWSLLMGLMVIIVGSVSSAALANGFVGYAQLFVELMSQNNGGWMMTLLVSLPAWVTITLLILGLGLIAMWGIGASVWAAATITLVEIGGLLLIVVVAGDSLQTLPARWGEIISLSTEGSGMAILAGAFLAFYAFVGFEDMVNVAEEVKEPKKNLPRGIIMALIIAGLLYFLIALVSVLSVPVKELAGDTAPLARVYSHATGEAPILISLISMVAVINGVLIQIIMASRVLYGLSWQGWLPGWLSYVHPARQTPIFATLAVIILVLVLALWLPLVTLVKVTSLITLLVFALVNLSLWRVKRHDRHPAGIMVFPLWVPIAGFVVSTAFVIFQLYVGI